MKLYGVQLERDMSAIANERWIPLSDSVDAEDVKLRECLRATGPESLAVVEISRGTIITLEMIHFSPETFSVKAYVDDKPWIMMTYFGGGDREDEELIIGAWQSQAEEVLLRDFGAVFSRLRSIGQRPLVFCHFKPPAEADRETVEEVGALTLGCVRNWHLMRMEGAETL